MAAIVGCIDSRVSPELIFDQHVGDIFAARIAGNFANTDIIGSLEFATKVAGAKAIVVVGHTGCGAVMGAIDGVKLGNLTEVLRHIEPAIAAAGIEGADRTSKNAASVLKVTEANAKLAAAALVERSDILRELVEAKSLRSLPRSTICRQARCGFYNRLPMECPGTSTRGSELLGGAG